MGSKRKVGEDSCTLVYTLDQGADISFEHFSLIVRSLHTYMVTDISAHPDKRCIYVKLDFQASQKNAVAKLGKLAGQIQISKLSVYVDESELDVLAELRAKYGFGSTDDCDKEATPRAQSKRSRYTPGSSTPQEHK